MKLERQPIQPHGVGTLMYVGDGTETTSIDAVKLGIGAGVIYVAVKSSLGPIAKAALVIAGAITVKRSVTVR